MYVRKLPRVNFSITNCPISQKQYLFRVGERKTKHSGKALVCVEAGGSLKFIQKGFYAAVHKMFYFRSYISTVGAIMDS